MRHLRYRVLDQPLGLPEKTESGKNDHNPDTIHLAAFDGDRLVTSVRLDKGTDGNYLVRRMATEPAFQGRGLGAKVLLVAEKIAFERGARTIVAHARRSAVGFYEKMGYRLTGKIEIHDGDENPEMIKEF